MKMGETGGEIGRTSEWPNNGVAKGWTLLPDLEPYSTRTIKCRRSGGRLGHVTYCVRASCVVPMGRKTYIAIGPLWYTAWSAVKEKGCPA